MWLTITRTFKEALHNFIRNGWLTVATVVVLIMSLYVVSTVYITTFIVNENLKNVQDKLSVSVYFKADTTEKTIEDAKDFFQKNSDVGDVVYVSKEQALENFKKYNANNEELMQSLEEIGENPLWPSLVVTANDSQKYEDIVGYVKSSPYREEISQINFDKTKDAIDKLNSIVKTTERTGITLIFIFSLIAVLITFNTIRVTIYAHKKEIGIMRLVGASNSYIRLPFIFEGFAYGLGSAIISMVILFLTLRFAPSFIFINVSGPISISSHDLLAFYWHNFFIILAIEAGMGIVLGVFSSLIAMRKYLKT